MNQQNTDDVVAEVLRLQERFKARNGSLMPLLEKHGERDQYGQLVIKGDAVDDLQQELNTLIKDNV